MSPPLTTSHTTFFLRITKKQTSCMEWSGRSNVRRLSHPRQLAARVVQGTNCLPPPFAEYASLLFDVVFLGGKKLVVFFTISSKKKKKKKKKKMSKDKRSAEEITPQKRKRVSNYEGESSIVEGDYLARMLTSKAQDMAKVTDVGKAIVTSEKLGLDVYYKREDTQVTFSHHLRTAFSLVAGLSAEERTRPIVAAGIGNFVQGIAVSFKHLNIPMDSLTLVIPQTAAGIQLTRLKEFTCKTVIHGADVFEAEAEARKLASQQQGKTLQMTVGGTAIESQGTIAVELLRQLADIKTIYVGVGSGALLASVVSYVSQIHPDITVVGVEATGNNSLSRSLSQGKLLTIDTPLNHFVEGTATPIANNCAFDILSEHKQHRIITVTDDEVCAAIKTVFNDTRAILEPAGALAVAGLKQEASKNMISKQGKVVAILGSANMEFNTLRSIAERCEETEHLVTVSLPEEKGSFKQMYSHIYPSQVTEFSYRFNDSNERAIVFMSFQAPTKKDAEDLVGRLNKGGFRTNLLTDNEMAKSHARYLVGGRGAPRDERLIRFSFPENTEALSVFLSSLPEFINITLFHYRNHGADFGKVLVGFDVPIDQELGFQQFLTNVNHEHIEETTNAVYRLFLR
eukprot:TRINITY_DN7166_c0_g1_i1.p1 TRINITY_DN7166_c0_g1~~TRINITY_DN7166_c0_g1_i1.p1  ORF type:complete len:626 (+),score=95.01 TRINITY_DN7166_c0_g1_i1:99-1976(+)